MVKDAHWLEVALCSTLSAAMLFIYVLIKSGAPGHIKRANSILGNSTYDYSLENEYIKNNPRISEPEELSREHSPS